MVYLEYNRLSGLLLRGENEKMKKEEKTELTRQKILVAAVKEFGSKGYSGASMNTICECGISKGLLYHNFKSKDVLYLSCVELCFQLLTQCLKEAQIGNDLEKYMRVRMRFFKAHTMEARIFFDAVLQPPEALREQIHDLKKELDELNRELYREILGSVQLRQEISYEEAMSYFVILQDMFNSYFSSRSFRNLSLSDKMEIHERDLPKMLDFMLYGIARRDS